MKSKGKKDAFTPKSTYNLGGKKYTLEQVTEAAKQSDRTLEEYINEVGLK